MVQHRRQLLFNACYGNRILVMRPAGPTAQPIRRDANPTLQYDSVSSVAHVAPSSAEYARPRGPAATTLPGRPGMVAAP